jgi:hypothetical protein
LRASWPRASGFLSPITTCSELSPPDIRYSKAYSLGEPKWMDLNPGAGVLPSARYTLFCPATAKHEPESQRLTVPPWAA